jgi:hypothetical protein
MMEESKYDPETGLLVPGRIGSKPISMREAIEQGLVLPETVFLVDKVQGKIPSLGALIDDLLLLDLFFVLLLHQQGT